jgi:hypothetical protein
MLDPSLLVEETEWRKDPGWSWSRVTQISRGKRVSRITAIIRRHCSQIPFVFRCFMAWLCARARIVDVAFTRADHIFWCTHFEKIFDLLFSRKSLLMIAVMRETQSRDKKTFLSKNSNYIRSTKFYVLSTLFTIRYKTCNIYIYIYIYIYICIYIYNYIYILYDWKLQFILESETSTIINGSKQQNVISATYFTGTYRNI